MYQHPVKWYKNSYEIFLTSRLTSHKNMRKKGWVGTITWNKDTHLTFWFDLWFGNYYLRFHWPNLIIYTYFISYQLFFSNEYTFFDLWGWNVFCKYNSTKNQAHYLSLKRTLRPIIKNCRRYSETCKKEKTKEKAK